MAKSQEPNITRCTFLHAGPHGVEDGVHDRNVVHETLVASRDSAESMTAAASFQLVSRCEFDEFDGKAGHRLTTNPTPHRRQVST